MVAATQLASDVGIQAACDALGVVRSSYYRHQRGPTVLQPRSASPRALSSLEQASVLAHLHEERFLDQSPAAVQATLLDEGVYFCCTRTMYRILAKHGETHERRDQRIHPEYHKHELLARAPNELWSWDITKLMGPAKWTYFYLYVILDVFSRYVVGWMIAHRESAELARKLIANTCEKQLIVPGQLTIHADRGPAMTSKPVAFMMADLGITKTHSRPHVSDDNPYSESQFRTMKYRPDFPDRFGSIQDARAHAVVFFPWYNNEHRHSGISMLTPAMVHYGQAEDILEKRQLVLDDAYLAHPERFVRSSPRPLPLPKEVWINKPQESLNKSH